MGAERERVTVHQTAQDHGAKVATAVFCSYCGEQASMVYDGDEPTAVLECPECETRWLVEVPVLTNVTGACLGENGLLDADCADLDAETRDRDEDDDDEPAEAY